MDSIFDSQNLIWSRGGWRVGKMVDKLILIDFPLFSSSFFHHWSVACLRWIASAKTNPQIMFATLYLDIFLLQNTFPSRPTGPDCTYVC